MILQAALPEDAPEDAMLLARISAGDEAALTLLIARHGRAVRAVAARYLSDMTLAEDIVQETFLKVWTRASSFDPDRGQARSWIFRIATNLCTDRYRRQRLGFFLGFGPDDPEPEADQPGQDREYAARQELDRVRTRISALPQRQRMALLLSAAGGLSTAEIAASMQTSPGAVEQLLVRARRTLRAALDEND